MKDISLKPSSKRSAVATCTLRAPNHCIELLRERKTAKGDALEISRMAGIMAAKNTQQILPFCHQVPILNAEVKYDLGEEKVRIEAEVEVIAGTGVEMEALTAANVTALCLYDMLKPHVDQEKMQITDTRLLRKKGGKSHFKRTLNVAAKAVVIVLSDTVAAGKKPDTAGKSIVDGLTTAGFEMAAYEVLPDESDQLKGRVEYWLEQGVDLLITCGGTGISPRDITIETVKPLITTEMPGLMEAARSFGQDRTPFAMMSRGVAGMSGNTLIATFPGSRGGAEETLAALLPGVVHLVEVCRTNAGHEGGYK